jgi:hypothetical protein
MIDAIRIATASEHHLPVAGGILDQSAWWLELKQRLQAEENRIQDEKDKK